MTDSAKRACVIGWPIGHSRSPLIHSHWLARLGLPGSYDKVAVAPDALAGFLRDLRAGAYAGCNVTTPHKQAAFAALDVAHGPAKRLKAANTLWVEDGALHGTNTDIHGFLANLDERVPGWDKDGGIAVVLGAGGAARAVLAGLEERGFAPLRVVNRTRANIAALARDLAMEIEAFAWQDMARALMGAQLVVNTTSLGMAGQPALDIDLAPLPAGATVCDIVYVPLETGLLRAARARGLRVCDGLGMLLHQAVPGFERWFGVRPQVTQELRSMIIRDIENS